MSEVCEKCQGGEEIVCSDCEGLGRENGRRCVRCAGVGELPCPECTSADPDMSDAARWWRGYVT